MAVQMLDNWIQGATTNEQYVECRTRKLTNAANSLGIQVSVLRKLESDDKIVLTDDGLLSGSSFLLLKAIVTSIRTRYSDRREAVGIIGDPLLGCIANAEELVGRKVVLGTVFYRSCELREFKRDFDAFVEEASGWIEGRELPIENWFFAFMHGEGCNATELVTQMGKPGRDSDLSYAINVSKQIRATRVKGCWKIERREIVRVLDVCRNRIGLRRVAIEKGYSRDTFALYGSEGLLGKISPNLSGADSILRSVYDQLDQLLPKITKKKERSRVNWGKKKLRKGELSSGSIHRKYKKFGLELGTIKFWLKTEMLLSTSRGKFRFIRASDFKTFAILTASGGNETRTKYRQIFQQICEKEGWT